MDPQFWHELWQANAINFHEGRANALLAKYWPSLAVPVGARVFVPMCGKSLDMVWLASQGYRVLGVELSEIAVRDFFAENGLTAQRTERDGFEIWTAGDIEIWLGNFFTLQPRHLSDIGGVYDRASLVAMPPSMQLTYAAKMIEIVPATAPILLLTFDYEQSQMPGPPFATSAAQVQALYSSALSVSEIDRRDALAARPDLAARGLTRAETPVFILRHR